METWQIIVSVCAGIITLLTLWEKIDGRKKVNSITKEERRALRNSKRQSITKSSCVWKNTSCASSVTWNDWIARTSQIC